MIEAFVDGQRLTLPDNFSLKLTEENPYFTKKGVYTWNLDLSLLDNNNARIYGHLYRRNSTAPVNLKRPVVFVVNNKVEFRGTEAILAKSGDIVSVQFVSGNSELNYISGSDLKIRSLDLGWDPEFLAPEVMNQHLGDLDLLYPNCNALALPFANNESAEIGNRYHINRITGENKYKLAFTYDSNFLFKDEEGSTCVYSNVRPQPFLCFVINKILNVLGYTVDENQFETHEKLKYAYIVHGYDTIEYAKMLPDWTVSEWLNQIELAFDCTFIINSIDKIASVKFNSQYFGAHKQEITVVDDYTDDVDLTKHVTHVGTNIGYSLDSDEYYKFAVVDKTVRTIADEYILEGSDPQLILESLCDLDGLVPDKFKTIFKTPIGDFIAYNTGSTVIAKEINALAPVFNNPENSDTLDLELKIIPASFKTFKLPIYTDGIQPTETTSKYHMQIPIAEHADAFLFNGESGFANYNLQNLISGSDSVKSVFLSDKMRIALYNGRKPVRAFLSGGAVISTNYFDHYPVPFTKSLAEYFCDLNTRDFFLADSTKPLSPKWLYDNIYSQGIKVDTTQLFKFSFLANDGVTAKGLFLIKNRLYQCVKIERDVDMNGFSPLYYGEFYPVI